MMCDFCASELYELVPSAIPNLSKAVCSNCQMVSTIRTPAPAELEPTDGDAQDAISTSTMVSFGRGQAGRTGMLYGWGSPQAWGSWSVADWSAFEMAVPISSSRLAFQLTYQAPTDAAGAQPSSFDIYIQERFCATTIAMGPEVCILSGRLPLSSAACGGRVTFELHQIALSETNSGGSGRNGIGLISCKVWPVEPRGA